MKDEITAKATRVPDWENTSVKGAVFASKPVHESEKRKVEALRAQQEAYEASLPSDPV